MILTILDDVAETFWKIIIALVGSIFKLVNSAYRIFLALAEADIFENAEFDIPCNCNDYCMGFECFIY